MSDSPKAGVLKNLGERFGKISKMPESESLFIIGDDAARIYFRYSKLHKGQKAFFGLRKIDLGKIEGRNSFLCFLVDGDHPPICIPYADFEELFRTATTAQDGQYKVQIFYRPGEADFYIPKQGRFSVNGYFGFETLERNLEVKTSALRPIADLSHSQVQTLLAGIGNMKGYDVFVPASDAERLDWSLTDKFRLRPAIPEGYSPIEPILSQIDVLWIASGGNNLESLFEVEHSTPVYSGLLRFNDVLLTNPKASRFSIVANGSREELFSRQVFRPTFMKSGLSEKVGFLEYTNVFGWHARLAKKIKGGTS